MAEPFEKCKETRSGSGVASFMRWVSAPTGCSGHISEASGPGVRMGGWVAEYQLSP